MCEQQQPVTSLDGLEPADRLYILQLHAARLLVAPVTWEQPWAAEHTQSPGMIRAPSCTQIIAQRIGMLQPPAAHVYRPQPHIHPPVTGHRYATTQM